VNSEVPLKNSDAGTGDANFQLTQTRSRTGLMHLFSSSSFLFPFSFTSSPSSFLYSPSLSRQASP
jgi:hypothetical protein